MVENNQLDPEQARKQAQLFIMNIIMLGMISELGGINSIDFEEFKESEIERNKLRLQFENFKEELERFGILGLEGKIDSKRLSKLLAKDLEMENSNVDVFFDVSKIAASELKRLAESVSSHDEILSFDYLQKFIPELQNEYPIGYKFFELAMKLMLPFGYSCFKLMVKKDPEFITKLRKYIRKIFISKGIKIVYHDNNIQKVLYRKDNDYELNPEDVFMDRLTNIFTNEKRLVDLIRDLQKLPSKVYESYRYSIKTSSSKSSVPIEDCSVDFPYDLTSDSFLIAKLETAFGKLTLKQQAVIEARYFKGLTLEQTANELGGIRPQTVNEHEKAALKNLKKSFCLIGSTPSITPPNQTFLKRYPEK